MAACKMFAAPSLISCDLILFNKSNRPGAACTGVHQCQELHGEPDVSNLGWKAGGHWSTGGVVCPGAGRVGGLK